MIMEANAEKERKLRFEMLFKRGLEEISKIKGKLTLPENPDDDLQIIKALWLIEQSFNASNAELRLHINLRDVETNEVRPLNPRPPYGESDPPKRG